VAGEVFRRTGRPQKAGEALARYLRSTGLKQKLRSPAVYECWPAVAGREATRHTRVVGFNNCVLYVEVDSAPWLHMLSTFKKPELLDGLDQMLVGARVKDIRFKIGNGPAPTSLTEGKSCRRRKSPPTAQKTSRSSPA
jgi:predicted nucleic acid-binding Zn ribbon protein